MEKFRSHTTSLAVGNKIMVLGGNVHSILYFHKSSVLIWRANPKLVLAWLALRGLREFNM